MEQNTLVQVRYFAQFQEVAGRSGESISAEVVDGGTAQDWYEYLSHRYGFDLDVGIVRAAVNGHYAQWRDPVTAGDELAFIPPVAGG